jgi:hypothetical protein
MKLVVGHGRVSAVRPPLNGVHNELQNFGTLRSTSDSETVASLLTESLPWLPMAQRVIHQLVDDLDGTEIPDGGETVRFGLDRQSYEIDLSPAHATQLRDALTPYVKVARRVTSAPARRTSRPQRGNFEAVRAWAAENGYHVAARGRISAEVLTAYENR